ncbi:MAG: DUF6758 family protein [Motilibacteraceae bacterium]
MKGQPSCPRCGAALHAPGLWSSAWQCDAHGQVCPLQPLHQPSTEVLDAVVARARVPVWLPWPLPHGWVVTGVAEAGDERTGGCAIAVACSGPNPLGGGGDLVLVAEEPGVGLGARYAGLPGPDPGTELGRGAPQAKLHVGGHDCPLWVVDGGEGRAAYAGEAMGQWLWAVLWPDSAAALLLEDLHLADLRDVRSEVPLVPLGALSPRLQVPPRLP